MRRLGSEHRDARVAAGLSLRVAAAASGSSKSQLWRFERGAEVRGSRPGPWRCRIEAETRVFDAQALERRLTLKDRDDPAGHLILLVADTRTKRRAIVSLREGLRELLPLGPRAILAALRAGKAPGGRGIVIL
jgi:transcriptional regulator with XRE-family HTH domain